MRKLVLLFAVGGSLLASNYRLVPLSSHGIALSSSNLAKSFNADAVFINPANMAFLDNTQMHLSLNYYNIVGSKYKNNFQNGTYNIYGTSDDKGKDFNIALPTFAYSMPIGDNAFLGFAAYVDFAALYGWTGDYAKGLVDIMDVRGGTAAVSYAYKITPNLSLGASITANYTRLKFRLLKDNAQNLNYIKSTDVVATKPTWVDNLGNTRDSYLAYSGGIDAENDLDFSYKLALTYTPDYFDNRLRLSLVYNSEYDSEFYGDLNFSISKFELNDFLFRLASDPTTAAKIRQIDSLIKQNPALLQNKEVFSFLALMASSGVLSTDVFANNGSRLASQDNLVSFTSNVKTNFLYPKSINLGIAYEYEKHEFMLNVGRTFWSKYKQLNIDITMPEVPNSLLELGKQLGFACANGTDCSSVENLIKTTRAIMNQNPSLISQEDKEKIEQLALAHILNQSLEQHWQDTTLISIGYRYNYDDKWSFMLAYATEDSPVKRDEISFLAKDSRMHMYSFGVEYRYSPNLIFNLSAMYQRYADVCVEGLYNALMVVNGKFTKQTSLIINLGFGYIF